MEVELKYGILYLVLIDFTMNSKIKKKHNN